MPELTQAQEDKMKLYESALEHIIMFQAKEMPKLGNISVSRMVDMIGEVKALGKDLEKAEETLKNVIKSKLEPGERAVAGEFYAMAITEVNQTRFNAGAAEVIIRRLGGTDADIEACKKPLSYDMMKVDKR